MTWNKTFGHSQNKTLQVSTFCFPIADLRKPNWEGEVANQHF